MLCWLASYPKSGNTWLRILLENHLRDSLDGVDINDLPDPNLAYSRRFIDDTLGVASAHLSDRRVDLLRPLLNAALAESGSFRHVRTHEVFRRNSKGQAVFDGSSDITAVLLVRSPFDVALSMARFFDVDVDVAIDRLCDSSFCLYPQGDYVADQLPQLVGSWSDHVRSWLDADIPTEVVRFEDLVDSGEDTFARLIDFLGLATSPNRRSRALANADLARLRAQEAHAGFRELTTGAPSFFGEGTPGSWRKQLTLGQVDRIRATHGDVMRSLEYDLQ